MESKLNQPETKILSKQVENHDDHKAKQVNLKDRKHTRGEINGTYATKKWAKEPYDPSEDYKLVLHKYKESY